MTSTAPLGAWLGFFALLGLLLALDLLVFDRRLVRHPLRKAALTAGLWISLGVGFGILMLAWEGPQVAFEYFSGVLIELSLSIDNFVVFSLVFSAFAIPSHLHYRVLFWGVIGALAIRLILVLAGAAVIQRFDWVFYVFGVIHATAGIRLWLSTRSQKEPDPTANPIVRFATRRLPFTDRLHGRRFVTRLDGRLVATPLLLALVVIEINDLVFAADSVPVVLALTADPFIVYTSTAFAMLSLRSLCFFLADLSDRFGYVSHGLSFVLVFVGAKLLLRNLVQVPSWLWLLFILFVVSTAVVFSLVRSRNREQGRLAAEAGRGLDRQVSSAGGTRQAGATDGSRPELWR
jgi:tellurite resistance protein TerC